MAVKECKYGCKTLLAWDNEEGYFVEPENNNQPHSRDRCQELKKAQGIETSFTGTKSRDVVKEAVNQDLIMAVLQEAREHTRLLKKIAGEE